MPSIGPQLPPPSSPKRKRADEEDEAGAPADRRPSKNPRPNDAEISLESDSDDDDYGPSAAPAPAPAAAAAAARPPAGPALPRQPTSASNKDEIDLEEEEDDDDDTGPAPAPAHAAQPKSIGPTLPPPTRRVLGPSLPPSDLSTRPEHAPDPDPDSDSDSDYGPALPGTHRSAQRSAAQSQQQAAAAAAAAAASSAPQRDSWMLAPGAASSGPDPTKLKARKFATGRAAGASSATDGGISFIWTETPEQKAKRLADAVLGRGSDPQQQQQRSSGAAARNGSSDGKEQEARVRAYTEATRGKSLYEEHQTARKEGKADREGRSRLGRDGEEEDDPSKRAFDKEKDMALGGRINHTQRRQLLNQAADFGGRFQKGKYL